jgi:dienelactone hydrolase
MHFLVLASLICMAAGAHAAEEVRVPLSTGAAGPHGQELHGFLAKPDGTGPFGAVVALHGCGGLSERFRREMLTRLVAWGYAVLVVDSFAHHPVKSGCGSARAASRAEQRPLDALAGVRFLSSRADIDPARIALLGYSQGAWAALEATQSPPTGVSVRAVVAYYPDCRAYFDRFSSPSLILVGALDEWTPANRCQEMMRRRAGRGAPVDLVVYPDAHHGFDWVDLQPARRVAGMLMQYHPQASGLSIDRHRAFLHEHIGGAAGRAVDTYLEKVR